MIENLMIFILGRCVGPAAWLGCHSVAVADDSGRIPGVGIIMSMVNILWGMLAEEGFKAEW